MGHWNYRVVRRGTEPDTAYYSVHEVYYDRKGNIVMWDEHEATVGAEDFGDVRWALDRMGEALDKPVLAVEDMPGVRSTDGQASKGEDGA